LPEPDASEVDHHRPAADVLAQGQRQRRRCLVVLPRTQDLRKVHGFASGVGNLQPDHGLAGDHVDHAHADHRQAARDVLVQVADLAAANARGGLHFEASDHRSRINADHLGLDTEILQFQLDLPRQRLQGLRRIAFGLALRLVKERKRRDRTLGQRREQRNLHLAGGAFALLDRIRLGLDPDRLAAALPHGLHLAHFLALGAHLLCAPPIAHAAPDAQQRRPRRQGHRAGPVHHPEPRHAGGEGQGDREQSEQEQGRAQLPEAAFQQAAEQLAEDAAVAFAEGPAAAGVQPSETRGARQQGHAADQPHRRIDLQRVIVVRTAQQPPAAEQQQGRQEKRGNADEVQPRAGGPCADQTADVAHRGNRRTLPPAGIAQVETHQADHQPDHQRKQQQRRRLAQATIKAGSRRESVLGGSRHQVKLPSICLVTQ